jgi:DNA repair protein SbcC/Rad50
MRPLKLAVKGFTAFRDEQEVDFEGLDLFAIVGPTGSGKSSVLDAMTYALFGEVDRVDEKSTRQMISQGQPRLAVTLEFEVGHERFRVTRSMPRGSGATKILVERRDGSEWRQAGEGVDRVKTANALLERLVGLDFDGFTRSVLLPQGKFSAFMAGDADQRRRILVDLLGLSTFERMGKRARQIAKEAGDKALTYEELIGSQYADATPEALQRSRAAAAGAAERRTALEAAAKAVAEVVERWKAIAAEVRELESCAAEAARLAGAASEHATTLEGLAERASTADATLRQAEVAAETAAKEGAAATARRADAEREWGTAADLARALAEAARLAEVREEAAGRRATAEAAAAQIPAAEGDLRAAEGALAAARAEGESRAAERAAVLARLEELRHEDAVAALVGTLKAGDPCPVCGEPMSTLPHAPGAQALRAAQGDEQRARKAEDVATKAIAAAEVALERCRAAAESATKDHRAAVAELRRCDDESKRLEATVRKALGELPADPVAILQERCSAIEALAAAEALASRLAAAAETDLRDARSIRERVAAVAATARAGLEALSTTAIVERATRIDPGLVVPGAAALPATDDLSALVEAAATLATAHAAFGDRLRAAAVDRAESEESLLREARDAVGTVVPAEGSLEAIATAVARAERDAITEQATRAAEVERIERDLAAVADLRARVGSLRDRARTFRALAQELQADRLIAFLQAEALRMLAASGSHRLGGLSSGRYELAYEGDEFLVVDRWNGDETRSVRTLSGGETFLASLALALALADQVSSLAVTEHASLDSLFLDEGFGTLDPETLDTVIDAIEQLGGDGRMVGVITHVRDLADRLPARLEVQKSPRGSTVRRAS